jgi:hypothetical protein
MPEEKGVSLRRHVSVCRRCKGPGVHAEGKTRQPCPGKLVRGSKSGTVGNGACEDVDLVTEGDGLDSESGPGFHDRVERAEQSKENVGAEGDSGTGNLVRPELQTP